MEFLVKIKYQKHTVQDFSCSNPGLTSVLGKGDIFQLTAGLSDRGGPTPPGILIDRLAKSASELVSGTLKTTGEAGCAPGSPSAAELFIFTDAFSVTALSGRKMLSLSAADAEQTAGLLLGYLLLLAPLAGDFSCTNLT
jgi:hypothetical protein